MPCNFMYVATHWISDQYMCRAKSNENCFSGTRKKVKYGGICGEIWNLEKNITDTKLKHYFSK